MTDRKDRGKLGTPGPREAPRRTSAPEIAIRETNTVDTIPSRPRYTSISDGPYCPTGGQAHGRMYKLSTKWFCPSQLHNGAPVTAKDGPREPTQHSFTDEEVLASQQSH